MAARRTPEWGEKNRQKETAMNSAKSTGHRNWRVMALTILMAATSVWFVSCGGGGGGGGNKGPKPVTPPSWHTPQKVNQDTFATQRDQQVVFDDAGNGLAVWVNDTGTGTELLYSYYNHAIDTWSPEEMFATDVSRAPTLATNGTDFLAVWASDGWIWSRRFDENGPGQKYVHVLSEFTGDYPEVASDKTGYLVTWYESRNGELQTCAEMHDGVAWRGTDVIGFGNGTPDEKPLTVSNGGGYAIAWSRKDGSDEVLCGNVFSKGAWQGSTLFEQALSIRDQRLAANGQGYALAWSTNKPDWHLRVSVFEETTGTWSSVESLETHTWSIYSFDVAGSNSEFALVWEGPVATEASELYASIYRTSTGWSPGELIESGSWSAESPRVGSDGTGFVAVWSQYEDIYSASWSNGAWTAEYALEVTPDFEDFEPQITSCRAGGYGVVWHYWEYDRRNSRDVLFRLRATTDNGSGWNTPVTIESSGSFSEDLSLVAAAPGYVATWIQDDADGRQSVFTRPCPYGVWLDETDLVTRPHSGSCEDVAIAVNRDGVALAVWRQYSDHHGFQVYGNLRKKNRWETPFLISDDNPGTVTGPPIVATNGHDFMIAWDRTWLCARTCTDDGVLGTVHGINTVVERNAVLASNGTGYLLVWVSSLWGVVRLRADLFDGTEWGPDYHLSNGSYDPHAPQVVSNGAGYAVTWHQQADGSGQDEYSVYANIFDGASWGGPTLLESSDTLSEFPRIASNGKGYAVTWRQYDNDLDESCILARIHDGSTWDEEETIIMFGSTGSGRWSPRVASNGSRYAVTWCHGESSGDRRIGVALFDGTGWNQALIGYPQGQARDPEIARCGKGYTVVWYQDFGLGEQPYFSLLGSYFDPMAQRGPLTTREGDLSGLVVGPRRSGSLAAWCQYDAAGDPAVSDVWAALAR